jgi:hypothetical protein
VDPWLAEIDTDGIGRTECADFVSCIDSSPTDH